MRKIKVFLGGFIDHINAQNINCKAIAQSLDKTKFKVYALKINRGKEDSIIEYFTCIKPFKITKFFGFIWGISMCDVAYLPKHIDTPIWVLKLARLLQKPIFTTIEGNVTDLTKPNLVELFESKPSMHNHFKQFDLVFGINRYLINRTNKVINISNEVLPLGVFNNDFTICKKHMLSTIVFVGSLIKRKRVHEVIALARIYPQITFNIIGDGPEKFFLEDNAPFNISFFGRLTHQKINEVFSTSDLLFLPSKSEGFPKVILEAASAGIPSVVYDAYGASEWIKHEVNGFIASDFDQVINIIDNLLNDSRIIQYTSRGALELANNFDWKTIINKWEKVIIRLYNGK